MGSVLNAGDHLIMRAVPLAKRAQSLLDDLPLIEHRMPASPRIQNIKHSKEVRKEQAHAKVGNDSINQS